MEIAHGLEPYHPMFLEEPLLSDDIESLAALARSTTIPLCESERLFTRWQFKPLLDRRAAAIAMPDLAWTGGISETRKIADLAAVMSIPIAPHNCGGPGTFLATAHVCTVVPNLFCLESVPEFVEAFYDELVVRPLAIADGMITPPELPGLGNELRSELFKRPDAEYEVSTEPSPWGKSPIHKTR
jgi:L-alanine-DL-glutamate epimerase-like enolase superfamily enzyme